jgi:hypothetical protein
MPCRDGTGPRGRGPMTGHGEGECVLRELPGNPGCFLGFLGTLGRHATLKINARFFPPTDTTLPIRQE